MYLKTDTLYKVLQDVPTFITAEISSHYRLSIIIDSLYSAIVYNACAPYKEVSLVDHTIFEANELRFGQNSVAAPD